MHWSPDGCRQIVHGRHDDRDSTRERSGTLMTALLNIWSPAESLKNKLRRLAAEAVAYKYRSIFPLFVNVFLVVGELALAVDWIRTWETFPGRLRYSSRFDHEFYEIKKTILA